MKKLIYIIIIIFLCANISSAIKISPTQTQIEMNQYETNCTNIWVLPHENFTITSKWSVNGMGDLSKYNLTKEKIRLEITYKYISDGLYEICLTPNKAGNFSGIIYFYSEKTLVEIGSWIDLRIKGVGTIERISIITGNTIKNYHINTTNVWLAIVLVLLFIILLILILRIRKSLKNKHS